jgi:hypothetical protein
MRNILSTIARVYRLGLSASLIIADLLLLGVFAYDLYHFTAEGYRIETLAILPTGGNLVHAIVDAFMTFVLLLLLLPLFVATIRVVVTRLRLPNTSLSPAKLFLCHLLLTLVLSVGVLAAFRMEVASGFRARSLSSSVIDDGYAYNSKLELLPVETRDAMADLPKYARDHWGQLLLRVGGLLLVAFTGGGILVRQRQLLSDYISASKLADVNPNYLPARGGARKISTFRPCSPASRVIQKAIDRELLAADSGAKGPYDLKPLAARAAHAVNSYLFENRLQEDSIRFMPDALSCVYTAVANESLQAPVILLSVNHPGLNELVQAWYGNSRCIVLLSVDNERLFDDWEDQENLFIRNLKEQMPEAPEQAVLVLPLVSSQTGQLFTVGRFIAKIKAYCRNTTIILDASFAALGRNSGNAILEGADYLCFNISQWISCSEPCGVLVSRKVLPADRRWEILASFSPANIRTLTGFSVAMEHAFERSVCVNDPQARFKILSDKFNDALDAKKLTVAMIPRLTESSYFVTVQPAAGRNWRPSIMEDIKRLGLESGISDVGMVKRLTVAIPPYVDFWQVGRFVTFLNQSVS